MSEAQITAGVDGGVVGHPVRLQAMVLQGRQKVQGMAPLDAPSAGADGRVVGDEVGLQPEPRSTMDDVPSCPRYGS